MFLPTALVDFSVPHADLAPIRLAFGVPEDEFVARTPSEVLRVLDAVEEAARQGRWCVGYLRYEAASAFDPNAVTHASEGPLAYFAIHRCPIPLPDTARDIDRVVHWKHTVQRDEFDASLTRIRDAIEAGDVYQVCYSAPLVADYRGEPFDLFCALQRSQPRANAAFIANSEEHILSVSPELFFDWDGTKLTCAPMKGTAPRGSSAETDLRNARELRNSEKERAENVMIVDLVRNDLSRIAELGSVQVTRLFDCEAWPTVWQMVSEVVARTPPGTKLTDVFRAIFPCGSITGAPKLRAMRWIRDLERGPRGVYCGAVGIVQPGGVARFNVPIRTVTIRDGRASCGIGSGITWSSAAHSEWSEWEHKASFLNQAGQPFQLLQTLRLEAGACRNLEMHMDRLAAASAHFGFSFDRIAVLNKVLETIRDSSTAAARVRILLDCRGNPTVEMSELPPVSKEPPIVRVAPHAIRAPQAFLRHKTTRREHYDQFGSDAGSAFDTLLWNPEGEVTEFTRGSVIVERRGGGMLVTPPLGSGLLDGVGRALAIASGRVKEDTIKVAELHDVQRLWFVNSLRGWIEVQLEGVDREP
jgi:para-aminobenzoate synthetase/4-amino-4-deoxychorismate lyase